MFLGHMPMMPIRTTVGANVSNQARDSPPSYDEVVRNRGQGKADKKSDKIFWILFALVWLTIVIAATCMVKDQLRNKDKQDLRMKIQDLISEIYNDGRFYKIVCSWKALEEGDLSLIEGEIVELKPLPLNEKKNGWLYGRSLGRKGRFPNIGGLLEGPIEASYIERVWQIIIEDKH